NDGPISAKSVWTTSLLRMTFSTSRRSARVPPFALVMSFSAYGRTALALASVAVIRPCSKGAVARLAKIAFWCDADPPKRAPFLGLGIVVLLCLIAAFAGPFVVTLRYRLRARSLTPRVKADLGCLPQPPRAVRSRRSPARRRRCR